MSSFELYAFHSNEERLHSLNATELTGFIVDLEKKGKELRQQLYNTQITEHTLTDLALVRNATSKPIICRINNSGSLDTEEMKMVLDYGADELLVPMIKRIEEVEHVLASVNGSAKVSVMLETVESLTLLKKLNELPLERCYVGLNDLAIQMQSNNIFFPLADGTIEKIGASLAHKLGVAGLTHPDLGNPIPCRWLIDIMKQNKCSFGILRRSFYRALERYSEVEIINALMDQFGSNTVAERDLNRLQFIQEVKI